MILTFINSIKSVHCVLKIDWCKQIENGENINFTDLLQNCPFLEIHRPQNSLGKNKVLRNEKEKNFLGTCYSSHNFGAFRQNIFTKVKKKNYFLKSEFIYNSYIRTTIYHIFIQATQTSKSINISAVISTFCF